MVLKFSADFLFLAQSRSCEVALNLELYRSHSVLSACTAVKGTIGKGIASFQRDQHFFHKTLIVHIAADFCVAFRSPLLGAKKEVVHVEHIAVILLCQNSIKGDLTCSAVTVDGNNDLILVRQK